MKSHEITIFLWFFPAPPAIFEAWPQALTRRDLLLGKKDKGSAKRSDLDDGVSDGVIAGVAWSAIVIRNIIQKTKRLSSYRHSE